MKIFSEIVVVLCLMLSGVAYGQICSVTTTSVNFGTYDEALASPNDSVGTITVTCNIAPPPDVTIQIGPSTAVPGSLNPRKMKHDTLSDILEYNIYLDASRRVIWGDGTQGTSTVLRKVTKNKPEIITIYSRIPPGQDVSVGIYNDNLTATIVW